MSIPEGWRNQHTDTVLNPKSQKLNKCVDCGHLVPNFSDEPRRDVC